MAIYHFNEDYQSKCGANSHRSGSVSGGSCHNRYEDTGEVHNYRYRKAFWGKALSHLPTSETGFDREKLWNAAEESEKRKKQHR